MQLRKNVTFKSSTMYNPFSLQSKTILVTGASSGIGREIAIICSRMGAQVIITGRNEDRLKETLEMMDGEAHQIVLADLTLHEELEILAERIPPIDGFVSNAGCNKRVLSQYVKYEDLDILIKTNLTSSILLTKNLLKKKKIKQRGSIIYMSSIAAFHSSIGDGIYSATKGAISSYARVLAMELSPKKIRVNCIQPGMVKTSLLEKGPLSADEYEADEKKYPLGRYGNPTDIAMAAVYLLSDATEWMTGSSIVIDGGISLI